MTWRYYAVGTEMNVDNMIEGGLDQLNRLQPGEFASAKVSIADHRDLHARTLVVWNDNEKEIAKLPAPGSVSGGKWAKMTWKTMTDYDGMYQQLVDFMNKNLTLVQAFYSTISLTNCQGQHATLTLYYRLIS